MADPITQVVQSLGLVTAYGYAKSKGYTGTDEEFAEAAAAIGQGAATASAAAEAASEDAETATTAAGTATTAAGNAENSATAALQYMNNAETAATNAGTAQTATAGSATSAAASAQAAATSEYNAGVAAGASSDYALDSQDHAEDSEAWAVGTKNGNPVPETADQYNNNAKYYADQASTATGTATGAAQAAAASAAQAEAWATGGSGGTASATNNAEYWAGQAAAQAEAAAGSAASGIAALANEASVFDATAAYSAGAYVLYNSVLYRFNTDHAAGTWTGTDATAIMIGPEIAHLRNGLQENGLMTLGFVNLSGWTTGKYINTNKSVGTIIDLTPVNSANYAYIIIPVKTGELYKVYGSGGVNSRLWAFVDTDYKLLTKTQYNSGTHLENLTAPANGFLIVNTYAVNIDYYVALFTYTSQLVGNIEALDSQKEDKGYYSLNDIVQNSNAGYISIGNIGDAVNYTPMPSSSWYFGVFPVVQGDIFKITGSGGNYSRLWCFVDVNDIIVSKSAANLHADNLLLTAPENGKLIVNVSFQNYDIQKRAEDGGTIYDQAIEKAKYNYKNDGLNILSAFSNVSCFGDSLTASVVYTGDNGDGTYQTRSAYKKYPWILGQKIGAEAESVATGGYSASDWWGAYSDRIVQKENQLIVIYLGTNGGLSDTLDTDASGYDYANYADTNTGNYCKIVAKSLSVGARVMLVKIHQGGGGNVFVTNDVIDKIAEKFSVAVVDVPFLYDRKYHAFPDNTGTNTLHYNDLGYAAFADALIRNVGFLPDEMAVRLIPV